MNQWKYSDYLAVMECEEYEPWSGMSCTAVDVVHCTTAGGAVTYEWHPSPQDIHCTSYMVFLQQLWDMGILVDGNWKALIPPGVKTPAAVLRSFPPEKTYGQDSAALFVSSFLCVSSGLSSLHHSDTLGFYSDYLGHSLVLVMFHQCPSCSYLFSTPCLSVPVTSHLVLSTFPILIPQRKNFIDITSPVWAESSC